MFMAKNLQKRGSGTASGFGGTGNNTNASAGYLNGNNSVANSNTNYAASFALSYTQDSKKDSVSIVPDSVVSKTEKIATTGDIQKAPVSVSRVAPEMEFDKDILHFQVETRNLEGMGVEQEVSCVDNPAENGKGKHLIKGIKTLNSHKRLRNVKAFLLNKEVIKEAIIEAREGKKVTKQLTWIMNHIDETVNRIHKELSEETYVPGHYRFRTIHNKDEKPRHLAILGFYDRCVQQLLKKVIQEKLRNLEPRNVYSNIPGRGTLSSEAQYCLYAQLAHDFKVYKDGFGLKMDIHHCYESISSDVIKRELFRYLTDSFARRLVDRMFTHIKYLPIGDPLSGLYVNLVLLRWHRHVLNNRHHLFDTCYFFCDDSLYINRKSKKELHQLCQEAREWFPKYANLHIKPNYKVFRLTEGTTFCGARVFPSKILVRQLVKKRMFAAKNKPKSLASYKGILEKTNSAHLSHLLGIQHVSEMVKSMNAK